MSITELAAPPKGAAHRHTILSVDDPEFMNDWLGQDFAWDFETSGLDYTRDYPVGVALTLADGRSYYIVFYHTVASECGALSQRAYCDSELVARRCLDHLFGQPGVCVVAHHAKFDTHFLQRLGVRNRARLADTMLAAQLVDENRSVSLKQLAPLVGMNLNQYSTLQHYEGFGKHEILGVPLPLVADYAMDDTEATWRLWGRLQREMKREGVEDAFWNIWMPCCVALQEMEAKGIALDMPKVEQALAEYEARAQTALQAIWQDGMQMVLKKLEEVDGRWQELPGVYITPLREVESYGELVEDQFHVWDTELPLLRLPRANTLVRVPWFNPGSVRQLRDLLFDWHAISVQTDIDLNLNAKGEISADKDTLKVIAHEMGEAAPAVLTDILEYRKCSKLISTYLKPFIEKSDPTDHHCMRTSFNQASTDTGRLSSSNPNLQNQPSRGPEGKLIRSCFVARPGHMLVVADYNMMELRMAAHFSRDPEMMRAFREGLDLHTLTAANQVGYDYETAAAALEEGDPAMKAARQIGKTSNFGLLYGMGPKKFQRFLLVQNGTKVSYDDAWGLIESFNDTYAGITTWKRQVERFAQQHQYVLTIRGRKRRLPDIRSDDMAKVRTAQRQAVNAVVQGSCADIICEAIPAIQQAMKEFGGYLLLQVHDELVAEVPEEYAESAARIMERLMVERVNQELRVPLVCEAGIGKDWASAK